MMEAPPLAQAPNLSTEFLTPEAKTLCERTRHKTELSDTETLMLAVAASQAALAHYFHPGERSAQATIETIGGILDHEDVVAALNNLIANDQQAPTAPPAISGP